MSDDTRPYKAGFEAMHERMHGGNAMDTLENAQKRAEYWKAEHAAANAEIETLRDALRIGHERYETARRMNPRQWADAWKLNTTTGKPFDEIIDDMRPFMVPNG